MHTFPGTQKTRPNVSIQSTADGPWTTSSPRLALDKPLIPRPTSLRRTSFDSIHRGFLTVDRTFQEHRRFYSNKLVVSMLKKKKKQKKNESISIESWPLTVESKDKWWVNSLTLLLTLAPCRYVMSNNSIAKRKYGVREVLAFSNLMLTARELVLSIISSWNPGQSAKKLEPVKSHFAIHYSECSDS